MYLEIIIESIILYISLAAIVIFILSNPNEIKYYLILTLSSFFLILALYIIRHSTDIVYSSQFILLKIIKLTSVIYLYFKSFDLYKKKLKADKEQRLKLLRPVNRAEVRKIINDNVNEIERTKENNDVRYQKSLISNEEQLIIRKKIEYFFENNKSEFLDSEFNLNSLSKYTKVPRLELSQTFSMNMNTTFNIYLNEKRIEYACSELMNDNNISIVILSEKCGYKSRASLYRNFNIVKGMSLVEYKKKQLKNSN